MIGTGQGWYANGQTSRAGARSISALRDTDAIGDLDYDGTSYYPDWPDSVTPDRFPSTFLQLQPTTNGGHRYPQVQFMTDASATELNTNCDLNSGAGCVLPPKGPGNFYPY